MRPRLVAIAGPLEGETIELDGERFVIGRQADCDLALTTIEISREHCAILRDGRRFVLHDLGSRHGTQVNSRSATETALAHSDLISLGTHAFLFLLDESSTSRDEDTDSTAALGVSAERKATETLHLDPARVDAALPAQARLARELATLLRLATSLQEHREIGPLAAALLDAMLDAVPSADRGIVLLREPGVLHPTRLAERGAGGDLDRATLDRVVEQGVAVCGRPLGGSGGAEALIAAPLLGSDGAAIGAIVLDRRQSPGFAEHHLELVLAIAGVASLALQNVLHLRWLESENQRLREEDAARHDMIGDSAEMRRVLDLVARVARADSTILVRGESGTGKELVARAIHRTSPRGDGPFVAVNCATLSEHLLESELFGHDKGAFTGALSRKIGKMEAAHGGTLFLDEI
ncbi:MAG: sigma 54-interacting transcriptional regulator, partial [Acidobacteriota bacterium]